MFIALYRGCCVQTMSEEEREKGWPRKEKVYLSDTRTMQRIGKNGFNLSNDEIGLLGRDDGTLSSEVKHRLTCHAMSTEIALHLSGNIPHDADADYQTISTRVLPRTALRKRICRCGAIRMGIRRPHTPSVHH